MKTRIKAFRLLAAAGILLFSWSLPAGQQLALGAKPKPAQLKAIGKLPDGGVAILSVAVPGGIAVLYQVDTPKFEPLRLSVFRSGKEQVLWSFEDGNAVLSGEVPPPLLLACQLDQTEATELILCFSVNRGISKHETQWNRTMMVFPNCRKTKAGSVPLAEVDEVRVGNAGELQSRNKGRAHTTESVAIVHISGTQLGTIAVWSATRQYAGVDEKKQAKSRHTLTLVRIDDKGVATKRVKADAAATLFKTLNGYTGLTAIAIK